VIEYRKGDIFQSGAFGLANPVNCVGVMGAGLALEFKRRFPANFVAYKRRCNRHAMCMGVVFPALTGLVGMPRWIFNVPTKHHWKDASSLVGVESGIVALARLVSDMSIPSVAIPALGCGLGGLVWSDVRPLIDREFAASEARVIVYEP